MDPIFTNSDNSKSSEPHILKLKLTSKLDLRLGKKVIALSNLSIYYTWENIKSYIERTKKSYKEHAIIINLKYQHQHGTKNLHYQTDLILYLISRIILNIF